MKFGENAFRAFMKIQLFIKKMKEALGGDSGAQPYRSRLKNGIVQDWHIRQGADGKMSKPPGGFIESLYGCLPGNHADRN